MKTFKDSDGDSLEVCRVSHTNETLISIEHRCVDERYPCREIQFTPQEARKLARYLLKVADKIEAGPR